MHRTMYHVNTAKDICPSMSTELQEQAQLKDEELEHSQLVKSLTNHMILLMSNLPGTPTAPDQQVTVQGCLAAPLKYQPQVKVLLRYNQSLWVSLRYIDSSLYQPVLCSGACVRQEWPTVMKESVLTGKHNYLSIIVTNSTHMQNTEI